MENKAIIYTIKNNFFTGKPEKLIVSDEKESFSCSFTFNMKGFSP